MSDVAGLLGELGDIPVETDRALVRQKSRDFFWYSPVLKRQLDKVAGEAIVTPRDEGELAAVLAAAARRRVPVTPRGAGTGNYGQAMPLRGGIVLDLSALDRVLWTKPGAMRAQCGAKLCTWGILREPGNILGLRLMTMEEAPRVMELRGPDIQKANHAYGTNGIITEVEMPLAPAWGWVDVIAVFDTLAAAARFADGFTRQDGIAKKLVSVIAAPVAQKHFKAFDGMIPEGKAVVLLMVAEPFLELLPGLLAADGGREVYRRPTDEAEVPLYEHSWNHTTLQVLKTDRSVTYLQTLFPAPDHLAKVAEMDARFGDEVPMHLEFVKFGGEVCCFGLQLVRFTTEARLAEIIVAHEAAGCPIFNPHAFTLEEGGMKKVDTVQLAFKREADPLGLLNPGKMLAWDDPDWTPREGVHLFEAAP